MKVNATVIINTFNEDPVVLSRCVNSYRNQFSQVIISTIEGDHSINMFKGLQYAIVEKENHVGKSASGAYQQINNALKLFDTDFLCYASGNDYAEPRKAFIETTILKRTNKKVCYSAFFNVKNNRRSTQLFHPYNYQTHLSNNFVSDCSMMTRDIVQKYLPYRIEYKNFAHWDSWLRIFEGEGNVFHYNPIPTWNYVWNENDMSKQRRRYPEKILQNQLDREFMLKNHINATKG